VKKKKPSLAETVSRNIRKARLEAGMTQKELADKAGFKVSYIARLETKPQNLSLETLETICTVLRVDPYKIVLGTASINLETRQKTVLLEAMDILKRI